MWIKKDNGDTIGRKIIAAQEEIDKLGDSETTAGLATEIKTAARALDEMRMLLRQGKDDTANVANKGALQKLDVKLDALVKRAISFHIEHELILRMNSLILHATAASPCPWPPLWTITILQAQARTKASAEGGAEENFEHAAFRRALPSIFSQCYFKSSLFKISNLIFQDAP